jgi:hypothetical protein
VTASRDPARELAGRRAMLLARSERLRREVAGDVEGLRRDTALLDRGVSFARSGLLVPLAVAGGLLLAFGRPSRVLRAGAKLLALWPVVRPLVPRIAALLGARRGAKATIRAD